MKLLTTILLLLVVRAIQAQEEKDCYSNQSVMNNCAADDFNQADAKLNKLYNEQMHYLQSKEAKAAFKKAQLTWLQFRDAVCAYEAPLDGGSMAGMVLLHCKTRQTQNRIEDLTRYVSCRVNGCPL